jgi:hypothetical protein
MERSKSKLSTGAVGLILVGLSALSLIPSSGENLLLWAVVAFGVLAGLIGLVVSIVGLFSAEGRLPAALGVLGYVMLAGLRVAVFR